MTTASHIHATSRKSALTVQCAAVTTRTLGSQVETVVESVQTSERLCECVRKTSLPLPLQGSPQISRPEKSEGDVVQGSPESGVVE